jgi:small-conductance mechanosensitive channel
MALEEILAPYAGHEAFAYSFAGNTALAYVAAAIVFLLSMVLIKLFKYIILRRLRSLAKKTKNNYDDLFIKLVDKIGWPFYLMLAVYLSFRLLVLPEILTTSTHNLLLVVVGYYIIRSAGYIIDFGAKELIESRRERGEKVDREVVNLLANISKMVLWSVIVLLVLANLGYDTSALLTGLGIGGIAIALALQTVLSDVFAYFSIHIDKPFRVGDFIVVGSDAGSVEKIGIKSTRIRSLQGQELVVSNKELTESRINNYKKMEQRRISFTFGIDAETPVSKIKKIPALVEKIIKGIEHAKFDRVHFQKFSDFSLVFEVVYFMTTPDYNLFMDTQQEINLGIIKELQKEKVGMPYPTQTVYVKQRS